MHIFLFIFDSFFYTLTFLIFLWQFLRHLNFFFCTFWHPKNSSFRNFLKFTSSTFFMFDIFNIFMIFLMWHWRLLDVSDVSYQPSDSLLTYSLYLCHSLSFKFSTLIKVLFKYFFDCNCYICVNISYRFLNDSNFRDPWNVLLTSLTFLLHFFDVFWHFVHISWTFLHFLLDIYLTSSWHNFDNSLTSFWHFSDIRLHLFIPLWFVDIILTSFWQSFNSLLTPFRYTVDIFLDGF